MAEPSTVKPANPDSEKARAESMGLHPRTETGLDHEETPSPHSDAETVPTTTAVGEPLIDEALKDPTLPRVPGTSAAEPPKP